MNLYLLATKKAMLIVFSEEKTLWLLIDSFKSELGKIKERSKSKHHFKMVNKMNKLVRFDSVPENETQSGLTIIVPRQKENFEILFWKIFPWTGRNGCLVNNGKNLLKTLSFKSSKMSSRNKNVYCWEKMNKTARKTKLEKDMSRVSWCVNLCEHEGQQLLGWESNAV